MNRLIMLVISKVLFIFLMGCASYGIAQNIKKADSVLTLLKTGDFSKKEQCGLFADVAYYHPDMNTALLYANKSLQLAREIGAPLLEAEALEEISHKERRLGNNGRSFEASFKALRIYETLNLEERQAATFNQLASNYVSDEQFPEAIDYFKKALTIYGDSGNMIDRVSTMHNLGEAYRLTGSLDSAILSFQNVLRLNESLKNQNIQSYTLGNLGMTYNASNQLNLAEEKLVQAVSLLKELGDTYAISVYMAALGEVYGKENKPEQAEEYLLAGLNMAKQARLKTQIRDISLKLSKFYETGNRFDKALLYQRVYQVYQDSLVNRENIQRIEQVKTNYEIEKRESEIGLLNTITTKQKHLLLALTAGSFFILLFTYLLYKSNMKIKSSNNVLRKQKEVISRKEKEKAILLKELNHRVKNNLQLISSLLNLQSRGVHGKMTREAIREGQGRVEALSLVHRKLYREGLETRVGIKGYMEELVLGLFHAYDASFEPKFEMEEVHVSIDTAIPLALVINEVVVNALKYAYTGVEKPELRIRMQKEKNILYIEVIDNGIGFTTPESKNRNTFGIQLIDSLINQLEGSIKKQKAQGTHWKIWVKPD